MLRFKKERTLYDCAAIAALIKKYQEKGGVAHEIEEGCLGYGLTVCTGEGLKTAVIKEIPVNTNYSLHSVRLYNEMPEKYKKAIEKIGA